MSEYTAKDFAVARFAEHPRSRKTAIRALSNSPWPWRVSDNKYVSDEQMAIAGWRPVREAAPLSLDALREAWEAAEVITDDNLPRKGDEVIESHGSTVQATTALYDWDFPDGPLGWRILRRGPRRPEGAEELEEVIEGMPEGITPAEMADQLAEYGFRLAASDG